MVFLIPWVPNMMVWTLFFLGKNLLFKRPCGYAFEHLLYRFFKGCLLGPEVNFQSIFSHPSQPAPSWEPKRLIFGFILKAIQE